MVMEVKLLQPLKQPTSKLQIESGMVMEVKPLQSEKHLSPKLVTEVGIVMEVKLLQPEKHLSPKLVTELGIWLFLHPAINSLVEVRIIALQSSLESYTGLAASTTMRSRLLQSEKHLSPKLVTELGMVMEVKLLQPEKQ